MLKTNEIKKEAITNTSEKLQALMDTYKNVSLRKVAHAFEVSYPALLKASKAPVAGEAYDPDAINWDAVALELCKREVNLEEVDWEELNVTAQRKPGTLIKDANAFNVGDKVYLRRNATVPYEIVYKTGTHIVIVLEGTQEPLAWAISTFMLNGPQFTPRVAKVEVEEEA